MNLPSFLFYYEHFVDLDEVLVQKWISDVVEKEGGSIQQLSYHFLGNEEMLAINKAHLQHDSYTDIITFDNSMEMGLCADLMISVEMVESNAQDLGVSLTDELHRVMVHGVLHLLGYGDKTLSEKRAMRAKEDLYLTLRPI